MDINEMEGVRQDYFLDIIAIYGEAQMIKYLSESILDKERIIAEHEA